MLGNFEGGPRADSCSTNIPPGQAEAQDLQQVPALVFTDLPPAVLAMLGGV